jgi:transcriptional regulator with XRE-family HTH domain
MDRWNLGRCEGLTQIVFDYYRLLSYTTFCVTEEEPIFNVKTHSHVTSEWRQLGRYLEKVRAEAGLSQAELAERAGLTQAHVWAFEAGRRWPSLAQLTNLARVLAVPVQRFLNGSNWPGVDWEDLAIELTHLGVVDLLVEGAVVPGAFRPPEQVIALTLRGDRPEPRLVEAVPAVLAWKLAGRAWDWRLLRAFALHYDPRALNRIAWLADVALTLHAGKRFPGGCPAAKELSRLIQRIPTPEQTDSLGHAAHSTRLPPVCKRWKITYDADLQVFRARAERLWMEREGRHRRTVRQEVASE